jgi:hypothetical protein
MLGTYVFLEFRIILKMLVSICYIAVRHFKNDAPATLRWFTPAILAIWEAEIWRIVVPDQPAEKFCGTPISTENSWVGRQSPVISARPGI